MTLFVEAADTVSGCIQKWSLGNATAFVREAPNVDARGWLEKMTLLKEQRALAQAELRKLLINKRAIDVRCDRLAAEIEALTAEIAVEDIRRDAHKIPDIVPVRMELA